MIAAKAGGTGSSTVTGRRLRFFCATNLIHPFFTCCGPSTTASDRRAPVYIRSARASRALLPMGCRLSYRSTSSIVHEWYPVVAWGNRLTSRAGSVSSKSCSSAHENMRRSALRRPVAASGKWAFRSRKTRKAFPVNRLSGKSPKVSRAPRAMGSATQLSRILRRARWVLASSRWNSADLKYATQSQRNVPAFGRAVSPSPEPPATASARAQAAAYSTANSGVPGLSLNRILISPVAKYHSHVAELLHTSRPRA